MPNPTTLDCRLLCASNVADDIKIKGGFVIDQCYYDPVSFKSPPKIITSFPEKIDACLVGTTTDDEVILAFRGTLMPTKDLPNILDWLQDFLAFPVEVNKLPGKVHLGFYNSVRAIWFPMLLEVIKQTAGGKPLIVTGHSKGAAMATLASMMLHEEGITAQKVTTFACPNSGDVEFATGYKAVFQQTTYTNHLDIIPFLPPSPALAKQMEKIPKIGFLFKWFETLGYHSASDHGVYIKEDGTTISQATDVYAYNVAVALDLLAIAQTAKTKDGITKILLAHMPGCPKKGVGSGGYIKGVCGKTFCDSTNCK